MVCSGVCLSSSPIDSHLVDEVASHQMPSLRKHQHTPDIVLATSAGPVPILLHSLVPIHCPVSPPWLDLSHAGLSERLQYPYLIHDIERV